MTYRYDTYCGLFCGACPVVQANEAGKVSEIATAWNMKPKQLICTGCKTDVLAAFCQECSIRSCAREKKIEFCYECSDYPCQILVQFKGDEHPHHSVIFKNLDELKSLGTDQWLKDQKKRWACQRCGTGFTWYDKTCSDCGSELFDCRQEEQKESADA